MTHEHPEGEHEPVPFFKNPKLVIPLVIICSAIVLLVFGYLAVDAFLALMQMAASTGATP